MNRGEIYLRKNRGAERLNYNSCSLLLTIYRIG
uniref:Uncharacterized protein n=1 Tax=Podoviridae sp. ct8Lf7 TaxID=2827723 RepID=A0A8S5S158_9CAUD|nr:MAG TPA: hypothetical protein [Podoviridae sp. ct8Lf7]